MSKPEPKHPIKRAVIYARCSDELQALGDASTLKTQIERCKAAILSDTTPDNQLLFRKEYIDTASGKDMAGRAACQQLLMDARSGLFESVYAARLDRLGRNTLEVLGLIQELDHLNIRIRLLDESLDTASPFGKCVLTILCALSQLERENIGTRVKTKLNWRAERKMWNGGVPPYGYQNDAGNLVIDPVESVIVREMFQSYLRCQNMGEIQRTLKDRGIRTREYTSKRERTHGGKIFTRQRISMILQDRRYLGFLTYNGEEYRGNFLPLIDESLFNEVQRLLKSKSRPQRKVPNARYTYRLRRLLVCSRCGSLLVPKGARGRGGKEYQYYVCRQKEAEKDCDLPPVPAKAIEDAIIERVKELALQEDEIAAALKAVNTQSTTVEKRLIEDKARLNHRIDQIKGKITELITFIENGEVFDGLRERMAELETERRDIDLNLLTIDDQLNDLYRETVTTEELAARLASFADFIDTATPKQQHEMLQCLIQSIEYEVEGDGDGNQTAGRVTLRLFHEQADRIKNCEPGLPVRRTFIVAPQNFPPANRPLPRPEFTYHFYWQYVRKTLSLAWGKPKPRPPRRTRASSRPSHTHKNTLAEPTTSAR